MSKMKYELKSTRHAKYLLHAHIIFTPEYRKKVFTKEYLDLMKTVFEDICKMNDTTLEEFDGEADHVYLLVLYPHRIALSVISKLFNRGLRQNFDIFKKYWDENVALWSRSYL
jgi:putative transposase